MGMYNSRRFSKEFSERTQKNLEYITKYVEPNDREKEFRLQLIGAYQEIIDYIQSDTKLLHKEIIAIPKPRKNEKSQIKSKLQDLVKRIEVSKMFLETKLNILSSKVSEPDAKLYEVTQLLNSLMGIAVLPFEMHKEYFNKKVDENNRSEINKNRSLSEIQDSIKGEEGYRELKAFILKLYDEGKWVSTYERDRSEGQIDDRVIVFEFLRHLRNAVCHSGENAISILPLLDGKEIEEILFYDSFDLDKNKPNKNEEFAMRLTVRELHSLVEKVAMFYSYTSIGEIDKTSTIIKAENRIIELLKKGGRRKK